MSRNADVHSGNKEPSLEEYREKERRFAESQHNPLSCHHFTPHEFYFVPPKFSKKENSKVDLATDEFVQVINAVVHEHLPPCIPQQVSIGSQLNEIESDRPNEDKTVYAILSSAYASFFYRASAEGSVPFEAVPSNEEFSKKEQCNIDDQLWSRLQENLKYSTRETKFYAELYSIPRVLNFIERNVKSINAFNKQEGSVFMTLVLKLFLLRLTKKGLRKLLKHSNPYVVASGLVLARYVLSPEDLDDLLIQPHLLLTPQDASHTVTTVKGESMTIAELTRRLVEEDELLEAWFPTYPTHILSTLRTHVGEVLKGERKSPVAYDGKGTDAYIQCSLVQGFESVGSLVHYVNTNAKSEGDVVPGADGCFVVPPTPSMYQMNQKRTKEASLSSKESRKKTKREVPPIRIHGVSSIDEELAKTQNKSKKKHPISSTPYL